MKIAFVGKFGKIYDEEYIARSFESIDHLVLRIPMSTSWSDIIGNLLKFRPDVLIYSKWNYPNEIDKTIEILRRSGMKTVCWLFDLYFDYHREHQVGLMKFFRSDYVISTDNGHNHRWPKYDIKHACVRQGIYKDECYMLPMKEIEYDIVFVGSDSPIYPERTKIMLKLDKIFNFKWFGKKNTDELRSTELNELYSKSLIVVGDSFYSPHYWSNRIVETLGRGGFLIHREVEGLKEEYPFLVTYDGSFEDLVDKINYYLIHLDERESLRKRNFEWVRERYTMDLQCKRLIECINQ